MSSKLTGGSAQAQILIEERSLVTTEQTHASPRLESLETGHHQEQSYIETT